MRNTLTIVAILLFVAGFAVAQPAAPAAPTRMPMGGMMSGSMDMSAMPDMTADQLVRMSAQRIAHLREVGPIKTDIAVKEIELADLWRADDVDTKKITAKVNELSALKAQLELAMANNMLAMRSILTPEQRKAMHSGMRGMMKGSMMPGMMMQGCPMMGGGMGGGMMSGGMSGACPLMGGAPEGD